MEAYRTAKAFRLESSESSRLNLIYPRHPRNPRF
jgi:hypothetical protein